MSVYNSFFVFSTCTCCAAVVGLVGAAVGAKVGESVAAVGAEVEVPPQVGWSEGPDLLQTAVVTGVECVVGTTCVEARLELKLIDFPSLSK